MVSSKRRRLSAFVGSLVLASAALAGCGGGDEPGAQESSPSASESASGSTSESAGSGTPDVVEDPYLPVPEGVGLTEPGSELEVGQTATVAWEPRQDQVGVLEVTVDRLEKTSFEESFSGWKLSGALEGAAPYFVRATVTNVGDTDLAGQPVPLYIVDGTNTLVEYSRFASTFKPCPSEDFPKPFAAGATKELCLVYLAPDRGDLTAVSFRPTQDFDPITWTGELSKVRDPKKAGTKGKGGRKGEKGQKQSG